LTTALSLANSTQLNINNGASLIIYVQGKASLQNSATINNAIQKSEKLLLYSSYTGSGGISFANSGTLYGGIYAPDTPIALKNSFKVYGSAIGKTIEMANRNNVNFLILFS
jgi:hypothetical protein